VKNDVILLDKLIQDTQNDKIEWVKAETKKTTWRNGTEGTGWYRNTQEVWKGLKKLTNNKHMDFVLSFDTADFYYAEIRVFFINDALKVRELIYSVDPGIFGFKSKKLIKELISILREKNKDKVANRVKNILGPPKPKELEDNKAGWRNFGSE